jgi:hypothetical protein
LATATGFAGTFWEGAGAEKVDVVFDVVDITEAVFVDVDGVDDLEKEELLLPLLLPPRATTSVWNMTTLQHNRARTHFFIIPTPFFEV